MASSQEYAAYIMEQLAGLQGVSFRKMMGEYILCYQGKVFGGIYDDRLLVKDIKASQALLPQGKKVLPYPGAKAMFLVEEVDDKAFLAHLIQTMAQELPEPKPKKQKKKTI